MLDLARDIDPRDLPDDQRCICTEYSEPRGMADEDCSHCGGTGLGVAGFCVSDNYFVTDTSHTDSDAPALMSLPDLIYSAETHAIDAMFAALHAKEMLDRAEAALRMGGTLKSSNEKGREAEILLETVGFRDAWREADHLRRLKESETNWLRNRLSVQKVMLSRRREDGE